VLRLVEHQLDSAGEKHRRRDAETFVVRLAAKLDPSEGCMPTSAGGSLKMSQLGVSST
jgi:hypothetical protein